MKQDFSALAKQYFTLGWCSFPSDEGIRNWVSHTLPVTKGIVNSAENSHWMRYQNTWFAGVNVLTNDAEGRVTDGPRLQGNITEFIYNILHLKTDNLDKGQISVCFAGYPKPMQAETEATFRYRLNRDAAHLDGLLAVGLQRRRYLREPHSYILAIPLVESPKDAAPFVVWEKSHEIIKQEFQKIYNSIRQDQWHDIDVTQAYQEMRKHIFEHCRRVAISVSPGETYLVHRHCLHGMAPWPKTIPNTADGRMICYFRPHSIDIQSWLFDN